MNEKQIEQIVEQIVWQLNQRVLVVLSPVEGYQQAIYQRLTQFSSVSFSLYATDLMPSTPYFEQWATLGTMFDKNTLQLNALGRYHSVFLPFIDAKVVGEVANGLFTSEESQLVLHALAQNIPVLALKHHCCPESELNQILGLDKNKHYNNLIKENMTKIISLGVQFNTFNEIENKLLKNNVNQIIEPKNNHYESRYITLNEVMKNPGGYIANDNKLTDSAIDYLKSLKK
ncbi:MULTISPECIES: hypothetical protein [Providencia]|uniref:hypothetical protein n=1 Tax=Providencia TaxID=586 RepID=UPI001C5A9DB6|nr:MULTISPECIES: hypothetical protein [Providencia]ELR5149917.1 hypothetical protein [Providencia rettgeri]QXX81441.1 hypothetical protein J6836_14360 [Providencia sp. R33]